MPDFLTERVTGPGCCSGNRRTYWWMRVGGGILPIYLIFQMGVIQPLLNQLRIGNNLTAVTATAKEQKQVPPNDNILPGTMKTKTNKTSTIITSIPLGDTIPDANVTTQGPPHANNNNLRHNHQSNNNTLPACEELMTKSSPLGPFADGSFLTRKTTHIVWKRRHDGSRELTLPSTCRLKRYTARESIQCLNHKTLLFVGDSLTRYQFMDLAYYLEHKQYPARFQFSDPCIHVDERSNQTCSSDQKEHFVIATIPNMGGGTDGGMYRGRMEEQSAQAPYRHKDKSITGMQYISSEADGGIKLNYVFERGMRKDTHPLNGWNFTGCASNASCRYPEVQHQHSLKRMYSNDFDWSYVSTMDAFGPNGTIFHEQYNLKNINYAIYNRGIWGRLGAEKAKTMMRALHRITIGRNSNKDPSARRCFFRSTTANVKSEEESDSWEHGTIRNATHDEGCEYLDVFHLTHAFSEPLQQEHFNVFVDDYHYQPWVYEELNNMLLNVLCNAVLL